jgi:hypothetical protein
MGVYGAGQACSAPSTRVTGFFFDDISCGAARQYADHHRAGTQPVYPLPALGWLMPSFLVLLFTIWRMTVNVNYIKSSTAEQRGLL